MSASAISEKAESQTPVEDAIREKLTEQFTPEEFQIINQSFQHIGHPGNPDGKGETHFKLRIVSTQFQGMNTLKRHRLVFGVLGALMQETVHACSLETKTPDEVEKFS